MGAMKYAAIALALLIATPALACEGGGTWCITLPHKAKTKAERQTRAWCIKQLKEQGSDAPRLCWGYEKDK
jgi:hypothetical protein